MPPQPGMFTLPYASAHRNKATSNSILDGHDANMAFHNSALGSGSRLHVGHFGDELKRDKKRREIAGRLSREMMDKKEMTRQYTENISALSANALQLATRPETSSGYMLRLYPLSLERSALLAQITAEEEYAHETVRIAYEEERDRVEEEWRKGRERIRERMLEGIEERRRRAREEKDGEGITDATLDSQSRSHITRKLRNKLGGSPPPSGYAGYSSGYTNGINTHALPATVVPVPNPNSLSVDELPSPFPLPLTASAPNGAYGSSNGGGSAGGGSKRKNRGAGVQPQALTGLGKAIQQLTAAKELEVEADLGDIRRGAKRKRAAATGPGHNFVLYHLTHGVHEGLLIAGLTSDMLRSTRAANLMLMAGEACTLAILDFHFATFKNFVSKLLTLRWTLGSCINPPANVEDQGIPPFSVFGITTPFRVDFPSQLHNHGA
ncbi:hypothetical protein ACEPAF_877 [Sanghuangporus sanghuang]